MIPAQNIVAWGAVVPWADQRQVEQDLIIVRALVEIFSDSVLRDAVRVRGGTALNKLHFPKPMRYSEEMLKAGARRHRPGSRVAGDGGQPLVPHIQIRRTHLHCLGDMRRDARGGRSPGVEPMEQRPGCFPISGFVEHKIWCIARAIDLHVVGEYI